MDDLMTLIENKVLDLIDTNSKLIDKIDILQKINGELEATCERVVQDQQHTQQRLRSLLSSISEMEQLIQGHAVQSV